MGRELGIAVLLSGLLCAIVCGILWRLTTTDEDVRESPSPNVHLPSICRVHYGTPEWIECMGVGYK